MRSDWINRLYLCPNFRGVPPVMELNSHVWMICYPFADQTLRGRLTAMTVVHQDLFKSVLRHCIETFEQNEHVGVPSQRDRSRNGPEIRCAASTEEGEHGN